MILINKMKVFSSDIIGTGIAVIDKNHGGLFPNGLNLVKYPASSQYLKYNFFGKVLNHNNHLKINFVSDSQTTISGDRVKDVNSADFTWSTIDKYVKNCDLLILDDFVDFMRKSRGYDVKLESRFFQELTYLAGRYHTTILTSNNIETELISARFCASFSCKLSRKFYSDTHIQNIITVDKSRKAAVMDSDWQVYR